MLDEMRALVALDEAGSFVRASERLCLTPSAATRMVQRLETQLGAVLLDRAVKPPRFTPLGRQIVAQCRDVLSRVEDLAASANPASEPRGVFRLGMSHAIADQSIAAPIKQLRLSYPAIRLRIWTDLTSSLLERLQAGELDAAVVLLPERYTLPHPLTANAVAQDSMSVVAAKGARMRRSGTLARLEGQSWVLNPSGCLFRASLLSQLEQEGIRPDIVAEVHNIHLQASLVANGHGLGLLPLRHVRSKAQRAALTPVLSRDFGMPMTVSFVQVGNLGRQEKAARLLEELLRQHSGSAY